MSTGILDKEQFLGLDGKIEYGKVVRYYRKNVRGWKSAQILVDLYNEALEETVSIRWMQRVEKHNKVPIDQTRRWVLATLLNIPPALLGLTSLESNPLLQEDIRIPIQIRKEPVDIAEYSKKLKELWKEYYTKEPTFILQEIGERIYTLQEEVLYGKVGQREQTTELLLQYHLLFANTCRDQRYYDTAITHFNRAAILAKEKANTVGTLAERNIYYGLYATALYLRGYVFFDRWEVCQKKEDRTYLAYARKDFHAAWKLESKASSSLKAALLFELGRTDAYSALDNQDRLNTLRYIDKAGSIVSTSGFQCEGDYLRVDEEYYPIGKAVAYVAMKWPKAALGELANVDRADPRFHQRRYAYMDIIEAQANIARGHIPLAVANAENALMAVTDVKSSIHFVRIKNIYKKLKQHDEYGNSPEVARLGVKLLKVQHPELFSQL